jgi:3-oxoacyl-[acyl-carrier protein] reductase
MELGLEGKQALVTGAGRGIGRAIALALAREGARVAVCSRTAEDVESVLKALRSISPGHIGSAIDLAPESAPTRWVNEVLKEVGQVDVAVHNVGGTLDIRDPLCPLSDWQKVWRLNLEVAIELDRTLIAGMQARRWGRIVHIASTASMENNGPVTYCTAKAAMAAYARCMGRIFAPDGIVVSAVLPGAVVTEGGHWERALKERKEHAERYLAERCPSGKFGTPEEIAGMVVFLCSNMAGFCQGAIVPVDGGQSRHYFQMPGE